jgi:hypothetical protein
MEVKGTITKIMDVQTGTSGQGKVWKKVQFIVDTKTEYNNIYCFEVFGEEKVDNFLKYNKTEKVVKVDFNVNTNEYQGKYYTSLSAWKIWNIEQPTTEAAPVLADADDDLPF